MSWTWGGRRAQRLTAACLARDNYRCRVPRNGVLCGRPASTADHIVPRDAGGPHTLDNLRAACLSCNSRRGAEYVNAKRRHNRAHYPQPRM
jgi:5-methylcytosine-specific restriction endonuclease McrA